MVATPHPIASASLMKLEPAFSNVEEIEVAKGEVYLSRSKLVPSHQHRLDGVIEESCGSLHSRLQGLRIRWDNWADMVRHWCGHGLGSQVTADLSGKSKEGML